MRLLEKLLKFYFLCEHRFIERLNRYLLKKSFQAAYSEAKKINEKTGAKVFIFLWKGDFEAVTKKDFKQLWQKSPAMKQKTIEQWQKQVFIYDNRASSKEKNTRSIKFKSSY